MAKVLCAQSCTRMAKEARDAKAEALRRLGRKGVTFESETTFLAVAASLTSGCVLVRIDDASPSPFDVVRALGRGASTCL